MADFVYHGSCIDGCYSGTVVYTFLNLLDRYCKRPLQSIISEFFERAKNNLLADSTTISLGGDFMEVPAILPEEFWLYDKKNRSYSVMPGGFTDLAVKVLVKSTHPIVFLVDCSGENSENLSRLAAAYKYVIVVDHHTSALSDLESASKKHSNILYYFTEEKCAFELTIDFFSKFFGFDKWCPPKLLQYFQQAAKYARANDLKLNETISTKSFLLGIYDLGLNLSSANPVLFQRLTDVDLGLIMKRGKGIPVPYLAILPNYLKELEDLSRHLKFIRCDFFKISFLGLEIHTFNHASDLGLLLCNITEREGYDNLAMMYRKDQANNCYRVSFRSTKHGKNPLALKLAQHFGGGGHLCAAGCKIPKQKFNGSFKFSNYAGSKIGDIAQILFQKQ